MANYIANGSSSWRAPTLGNLLTSNSVFRFEIPHFVMTHAQLTGSDSQAWFSQGTTSDHEFRINSYNNSLRTAIGDKQTILSDMGTIFGLGNGLDGYFAVDVNFATGDVDVFYLDSETPVYSETCAIGTTRADGADFMVGGLADTNVITDTTSRINLSPGVSLSGFNIYQDGILIRSYQIPASGLTIPDVVSNQDATLYGDDETAWSLIIEIENVEYLPPTGWDFVTYDGSVIPEGSVMHYGSGSHDGGDNVATLSDSTATFVVNDFVGLQANNLAKATDGAITANTATTVTAALDEGDWDIGDLYSITIAAVSNMQLAFETETNLGGTVNMNPNGTFSITGVSGNHTFSVKYLDPSDGTRSSIETITTTIA